MAAIENSITISDVKLDAIPEGTILLRIDSVIHGSPHTHWAELRFDKNNKKDPVSIHPSKAK
jgi:hypothetical protein